MFTLMVQMFTLLYLISACCEFSKEVTSDLNFFFFLNALCVAEIIFSVVHVLEIVL